MSNFLWGWWGDHRGKQSLLQIIAYGRMVPPAAILIVTFAPITGAAPQLVWYAGIFFVLGALVNGLTIAVIGYLMDISPDELRPAYSGYFNAITAPAYLLPLLGGAIAAFFGFAAVFAISMVAAMLQYLILSRPPIGAGRRPGKSP